MGGYAFINIQPAARYAFHGNWDVTLQLAEGSLSIGRHHLEMPTAYAAPAQYLGKKAVERMIEIDGVKGLTLEGSGVEIKEITLRGRLMQDLK